LSITIFLLLPIERTESPNGYFMYHHIEYYYIPPPAHRADRKSKWILHVSPDYYYIPPPAHRADRMSVAGVLGLRF